jgi:hypothetical protein
MRKLPWIALLVVAVAGSALAQEASIDPGMSREQVVARLGKPVSEHSSGARTYLYYANGDEKKYGMHDLVALENGKVVDAVFRASSHKYSGKSSSPAPVPVESAIAKGHGGHMPPKPQPAERKPEPQARKDAPAAKKEAPPVKRAEPSASTKGEGQPKAIPPAARLHEPLKGVDTKKIAPDTKSPDTSKKATPAPTKKP